MKNVLMISYLFPPVSGSGVQRTSKYVKYLPQFNWQPIVLTVKGAYDYYADPALDREIPEGVAVYRTRSVEPLKGIRRIIKHEDDRQQKLSSGTGVRIRKPAWLLRLKDALFIPDTEIGWLPFAVIKGWHLIRSGRIDIIYSTSSPYTDHVIGLILKKLTGKPWIADFRDPWTHNILASDLSWRQWTDRLLEARVIERADAVITATRSISEDFSTLKRGSVFTITNGYDEDDFTGVDDEKYQSSDFLITHTGIFGAANRSPAIFLSAVSALCRKHAELKRRLRIRFIGQFDKPGETKNRKFLESLDIADRVEVIGYKPHRQSIAYSLASDVLLLKVDDEPGTDRILTGKIFEYLRCKKPILALVPPHGEAAGLIRESNAGLVVHPEDVQGIQKGVLSLFKAYEAKKDLFMYRNAVIQGYDREVLAGKLAGICDRFYTRKG